ncbi:unnamed protein product [Didymodactylos carnosus]|uniref:Uncharacterized protein n=1 Tax=Didymodactylos carnosus TaxID=1234261 RepID=A0A815EYV1_9BILA|nr:unnamed protein product [Didymodactylos carnosus]CAF1321987.1 unnamed protein product [Didymodactylos carnosus]CAF3879019.1 unnamed protein product [Didymodactylos carnosus]CAF4168546.1 unnamed protein product [Didymodactylos carnosus]
MMINYPIYIVTWIFVVQATHFRDGSVTYRPTGNVTDNQTGILNCILNCMSSIGYDPPLIRPYCTNISTALGVVVGQRSDIVDITANSSFTVAYQGSPRQTLGGGSGLGWSIACDIDVQLRPDGKINTSPVSIMVSSINIQLNVQ